MMKSVVAALSTAALLTSTSAFADDSRAVTVSDRVWDLTAARGTIPAGWRFAGVAFHPLGCALPEYDYKFAAESADGRLEADRYPTIQFSYSTNPQVNAAAARSGCIIAPNAHDFLVKIAAPNLHPGGIVAAIGPMPGSDRMVAQMLAQDREAAQQRPHSMGSYEEPSVEALGMQIEYRHAGKKVSSLVYALVHCDRGVYPAARIDSTNCLVNGLFDERVPDGDAAVARSFPKIDVGPTHEWANRVRAAVEKEAAIDSERFQQRYASDVAATSSIHDMTMQMIRGYARASEAIHQQNEAYHEQNQRAADAAGDHEKMLDPTTGNVVDVSNRYSHTYRNTTDGTVLQTNSAYSPGNAALWTELQPK